MNPYVYGLFNFYRWRSYHPLTLSRSSRNIYPIVFYRRPRPDCNFGYRNFPARNSTVDLAVCSRMTRTYSLVKDALKDSFTAFLNIKRFTDNFPLDIHSVPPWNVVKDSFTAFLSFKRCIKRFIYSVQGIINELLSRFIWKYSYIHSMLLYCRKSDLGCQIHGIYIYISAISSTTSWQVSGWMNISELSHIDMV